MFNKNDIKLFLAKIFFLIIVFIPSWTNYFLIKYPNVALPGLSYYQLIYFIITLFFIYLICGAKILVYGLSASSILSISVVFIGGFISFLEIIFIGMTTQAIFQYSPHYISLLITMFTVVPISIAILSSVPIRQYEFVLLNRIKGVSFLEKALLIFTRVFTHVIFTVIPTILLIKREEKIPRKSISLESSLIDIILENFKDGFSKIIRILLSLFQIALTSICSALEYIPLWAIEISSLPSKKQLRRK